MSSTLPAEIQVGTKVIRCDDFGAMPVLDKVERLTKVKFVLESDKDKDKDKSRQTKWESGWDAELKDCYVPWESHSGYRPRRASRRCYLYSLEAWNSLVKRHEKCKKAKEEEKRVREERQKERETKAEREMAETWAAVGGDSGLILRQRAKDVMPDGTRLYLIDIPVKPEYEECKKGWERLWIRCHDMEEPDWASYGKDGSEKTIRKVECSYTYTNRSCSSFAFISSSRHVDDLEAIWYCVNRQYHSW